MVQRVSILAASVLLAGILSVTVAETTDAQFQAAWQAADAARQRAAELGHEWRDTALQLEEAKALAAEGDYEQAMRLVEHAKLEGERAAEQAEQQSMLWQDAVPK